MNDLLPGVTASLIAMFVGWLFVKVLWPLFVDQALYRGIRINGTWDIVETRSGTESVVGTIALHQQGNSVTGTGERRVTREGKDSDRKFNYKGRFAGEQLTLIFQDARGVDFDCGTYVFKVHNNGTEMVGMSTFDGKRENRIVSEKRMLRKKPG